MGKKKERNVPVQVGQEVEIEVTGLTHEGDGVGRVEGFALFVPYTVPGDRVRVKVTEVKKSFGRGELVNLLEGGEGRTEPGCSFYGRCGGCQLQHVSYPRQLALKTQLVKDAITRIGGFSPDLVREIKGTTDPWNYRNRGQFPVGESVGYFMAGSRELVPVDSCALQHQQINRLIQAANDYLPRLQGSSLKHLVCKVSPDSGETMVVLVTEKEMFPEGEGLAGYLKQQVPGLVSVVHNVNPNSYGPVLGKKSKLLWGQESLGDTMNDLIFDVSAESFTQVNPEQTKVLYQEALAAAQLTGKETVIDAYCGIGTISLFLARDARKVIGIEVVPEAIEDARNNGERNGFYNTEFIVGKVEEILPRLAKQGVRAEVIVVDPPRKGCDPKVLSAMAEMNPDRIVYVSCNPTTLARDLKILAGEGYEPQYVQPVDMFPHTSHVECVILMQRSGLEDGK